MFGPAGCSVLTLEWEEKQGSKPGEHKGGPFLGQPWTSLDPFCCFVLPPSVPRLKVPLGRAHTPKLHTFTHSHFLMNFLRGISYSSGCPRVYSVANDDLELLALCLPPAKYWDYRLMGPHPTSFIILFTKSFNFSEKN